MRDRHGAQQMWDKMIASNITPNLACYSMLLHAGCLDEYQADGSIWVDYKALIKDMQSHGIEIKHMFFTHLLTHMRRQFDLRPDTMGKGLYQEAVAIVDAMRRLDITPDLAFYNVLLSITARENDSASMTGVLAEIQERGYSWDAFTVNAVSKSVQVYACCV
jgi:hypothetical protein